MTTDTQDLILEKAKSALIYTAVSLPWWGMVYLGAIVLAAIYGHAIDQTEFERVCRNEFGHKVMCDD